MPRQINDVAGLPVLIEALRGLAIPRPCCANWRMTTG